MSFFTLHAGQWFAVQDQHDVRSNRYLQRNPRTKELEDCQTAFWPGFPAFWSLQDAEEQARLQQQNNAGTTSAEWAAVPLQNVVQGLEQDCPFPLPARDAQQLYGARIDLRSSYALAAHPGEPLQLELRQAGQWTQACSGCYEGHDIYYGQGHGCDECGYKGRRRQGHWLMYLKPENSRD